MDIQKSRSGEMHWLFLIFANSGLTFYDHSYQSVGKSYHMTNGKQIYGKCLKEGCGPLLGICYYNLY